VLSVHEPRRPFIGATASWTAAALCRFGGLESARGLAQSGIVEESCELGLALLVLSITWEFRGKSRIAAPPTDGLK
jgi:hypothetical protein